MATTPLIPYNKQPLSPSDQCSRLISRGLHIEDIEHAKRTLSRCSYFRFKGYLHPFKDHVNKTFNPNSTFEDGLKLYIFDSELRTTIFKVIGRIEVGVRCTLDDWITRETGNLFWYLDASLFSNPGRHSQTISKLKKSFNDPQDDASTHYRNKYHNSFCPVHSDMPPAWNVFELMTIGNLHEVMKGLNNPSTKQLLKLNRYAEKMLGIKNFELACSWLGTIRQVRNVSAHYGRLFNRNFTAPKSIKSVLDPNIILVQTRAGHDQVNRLYSSIAAMQVIYKKLGYDEYIGDEVDKLFINYPIVERFRESMGFPEDWREEKLIHSI